MRKTKKETQELSGKQKRDLINAGYTISDVIKVPNDPDPIYIVTSLIRGDK